MRRKINHLVRQLQGNTLAIAVGRHEENEHVALLVHRLADVVHGRLEITQRRERHVGRRGRMIDQANHTILNRQDLADCSQPTVDLFGEDIERGPTGYADGINVGLAFAVRRKRRSLGLQQRGLPLLQPGKLAATRRRTTC